VHHGKGWAAKRDNNGPLHSSNRPEKSQFPWLLAPDFEEKSFIFCCGIQKDL